MNGLIEHLVTRRVVGFLEMDAAVQRVKREGGRLSTSILEESKVDEEELIRSIAKFEGIEAVTDDMLAGTDDDLVHSWSARRSRKLGAIPLRITGQHLDVGVLEPLGELEHGVIAEEFGCEVREYLIHEFRFFELLGRYFGTPIEGRHLRLATRFPLEKAALPSLQSDKDNEKPSAENQSVSDPMEDVFDVEETAEESPSNRQEEYTQNVAAAISSNTNKLKEFQNKEAPAETGMSTDSDTVPEGQQDDSPGPSTQPPPEDDQVWAEVKRESGLLRIPDVKPGNSLTKGQVDSNDQTAPEINPIEVPENPNDPLESATWTFEELSKFYQFVNDRDQALLATLGFMRRFFRRRLFLRFQGEKLVLQRERGFGYEGDPGDIAMDVRPLSGLDAMRQGNDYFHGPPSQIGMKKLYEILGAKLPDDMIILPITLAERTVMLFVGDVQDRTIDERNLALAFVVRRQLSDSLELQLLRERRNSGRYDTYSHESEDREQEVMSRLTGSFQVPNITTGDRGIVSLPTEGWDLPEAFDNTPDAPEGHRGTHVTSGARVVPREKSRRHTPEMDDQDIVRQVNEDSGWFDIEFADKVKRAEQKDEDSGVYSSLPLALSKQAQSDSHPNIPTGIPGVDQRNKERTANFQAVGGASEDPHPVVPDSADKDSPPTEEPSSRTTKAEQEDDLGLMDLADIYVPEDDAARPSPENSIADEIGTDNEETFAKEFEQSLGRGRNETRELNAATATKLLQESSGSRPLPEDDADVDTDTNTNVDTDEGETGGTLMFSPDASPPPPPSLADESSTDSDEPSAESSSEKTEGSALIEMGTMRKELERSEGSGTTLDPGVQTIVEGEHTDSRNAVAEIIARPASRLPYLARQFPGPLWLDRADTDDVARPVYEHGPLLRIMYERLPSYMEQLWASMSQPSPDARYYALRILAFVRELELRESLLEALFDSDNDVRRLGLQLIYNHRHQIDIEHVIRLMCAGAESANNHLVESSVIALTKLRAARAIPLLIQLLEHPQRDIRERAKGGLIRLTFASHDHDKVGWEQWYEQHQDESEEIWLTQAMTSDERARRRTAAKFLHRMPRLAVNYHADISERQQKIARRAVEQYYGINSL